MCSPCRPLLALLLTLLLASCGDKPAPTTTVPAVPTWAKVAPEQIAEAAKHGVPVAFENDLGMRFVLIPAGTFLMGSEVNMGMGFDETPQHEVTLTRPYYVQTTEVTNEQYRRFRPEHDNGTYERRSFDGDRQPVVMVDWNDATAFADWATRRDSPQVYRLPTEAEWEHACRAGTTTGYWSGSREEDLARVAWYSSGDELHPASADSVAAAATHPVGEKPPNPWGLHEMHGNVWEHCQDWYEGYVGGCAQDPAGPANLVGRAPLRVARGGSFLTPPYDSHSFSRAGGTMSERTPDCGFRLVSPLPEPGEGGR